MSSEVNIREANKGDLAILVQNNQALAEETEALLLDKDLLREGIEQALKIKELLYLLRLFGREKGITESFLNKLRNKGL